MSRPRPNTPQRYLVRPAFVVPLGLSIVAIWFGLTQTYWAFLAIPIIGLGSICAAPNLNLADGFLVLVALVIGLIVLSFHTPAGSAMLLGSLLSWVLSAAEKAIRLAPMPPSVNPDQGRNDTAP